ncbi:MAG: 2-phosphosulfolactate phosphatase [Candidatus Heimdallarchaeaceae archaeon]
MQKIEVLSPIEVWNKSFHENDIFIVVDTFRASTSLVTLIDSGAERIFVVGNKKEAIFLKEHFNPSPILIGEKNGFKIKGFNYGNNPSLFYDLDFRGYEIVFTSTSGAKRILLLQNQKYILIGSLVNLTSISEEAVRLQREGCGDIYIIPVGYYEDEEAYIEEDWITSVLIAEKVKELEKSTELVKSKLFLKTEAIIKNTTDLSQRLKETSNGQKLNKMGFKHDVEFAVSLDRLKKVPMVKEFKKINGFTYAVVN